jgi:hypothetical protein
MEPKNTLSCLQEPTTGPRPETVEFIPQLDFLHLKHNFNIIIFSVP